jgi:hypothetical protein
VDDLTASKGEQRQETTFDAEFVAPTQLQADVTSDSDLARAASGLVETAPIGALRTA